MSVEEEVLEKIKFVLSCGNEAQAIRIIEQYGYFKTQDIKKTKKNESKRGIKKES